MIVGYTFYDDKTQRWGVAAEGIQGYLLHAGDTVTVVDPDGRDADDFQVELNHTTGQWILKDSNLEMAMGDLSVVYEQNY